MHFVRMCWTKYCLYPRCNLSHFTSHTILVVITLQLLRERSNQTLLSDHVFSREKLNEHVNVHILNQSSDIKLLVLDNNVLLQHLTEWSGLHKLFCFAVRSVKPLKRNKEDAPHSKREGATFVTVIFKLIASNLLLSYIKRTRHHSEARQILQQRKVFWINNKCNHWGLNEWLIKMKLRQRKI